MLFVICYLFTDYWSLVTGHWSLITDHFLTKIKNPLSAQIVA
ncbi:hypothetical protein [Dactylococcopsis salina]|nr:hypothetical protein [Dactylococcopsis salina]